MKKNKIPVYKTEEQEEITRFIIILLVVVAVVLGVYFFTKNIVKKTKLDTTDSSVEGSINYDVVTVGTMLNKQDKEYYVIAYDKEDDSAVLYDTIINLYKDKESIYPIYVCDLNNDLNKEYVAQESNPAATKIEDFRFNGITLLKIKKGKVIKYIEGLDSIKTELDI